MKTKYSLLLLVFLVPFLADAQKKSPNMNEDGVYSTVEEKPEYPGGEKALRTFIAENVKYPTEAIRDSISGKVYVSFIVDEKGNVEQAKIARSVNPLLDKEAIRVVKLMDGWIPGKEKGEAVKVSYTVPINFALK